MEKQMIQNRLRELEDEIAETLRRLPAHSVKPPVMIDLLALEDERDMLLKKFSENQ
ncbi:MAG: hypothetical protein OEL83_20680 [Desulforhopalus sp.]|nr:hypothetical protein [Desulforhopalus sp.]